MKANLKTLQSAFPSATKLVVTGHSLGGAMATLFAMDLVVNEGVSDVSLVTFGSPRVGNAAFSDFVNKHSHGHQLACDVRQRRGHRAALESAWLQARWAEVHYVPSDGGHYYLIPPESTCATLA